MCLQRQLVTFSVFGDLNIELNVPIVLKEKLASALLGFAIMYHVP